MRLTVVLLLLISVCYGQTNTFPSTGYAGVGTTSPLASMHIVNSDPRQAFRVYWSGNSSNYVTMWQGSGAAIIEPIGTGELRLGYDQQTNVTMGVTSAGVNNNGKLGIGTATPAYKLDVTGPVNEFKARFQGPDGYITIGPGNSGWAHIYTDRPNFIFNRNVWSISGGFSSYTTANLDLQTNGVSRMTILNSNGNVGIGTATPDAKLSVKGQVHAQEVKVDLNGAVAPDYVFNDDYKLPSLKEIQSYITANKHLPEVPSAKELEANGINLGEMNLMLLKKVEELTLYLLEQDQKYNDLLKQVSELRAAHRLSVSDNKTLNK